MSLALTNPAHWALLPALLLEKGHQQLVAAPSLGACPSLSPAGMLRAWLASLQPSNRQPCMSLRSCRQDQWVQRCPLALCQIQGEVSVFRCYQGLRCHPGPCLHPVASGLWVRLTCSRQGLLLPWELSQAKSLLSQRHLHGSTVFPVIILVFFSFWPRAGSLGRVGNNCRDISDS